MKKPEVIAKFETYDGKRCVVWSDGLITAANGAGIAGVGASKDSWPRKMDVVAAEWLIGDASLYDWSELPVVVKAARNLARKWNWGGHSPTPENFRYAVGKAINKLKKNGSVEDRVLNLVYHKSSGRGALKYEVTVSDAEQDAFEALVADGVIVQVRPSERRHAGTGFKLRADVAATYRARREAEREAERSRARAKQQATPQRRYAPGQSPEDNLLAAIFSDRSYTAPAPATPEKRPSEGEPALLARAKERAYATLRDLSSSGLRDQTDEDDLREALFVLGHTPRSRQEAITLAAKLSKLSPNRSSRRKRTSRR